MNPFEMVVMIVAITAIASVLRAKYGRPHSRRDATDHAVARTDPDATRAREEIKALKDRIAVLERLATDTNSANALDREIEKLR